MDRDPTFLTPLALAVFSPPLRGLGSEWGTSAHSAFCGTTGSTDMATQTAHDIGAANADDRVALPREFWDQRQTGATHSCHSESGPPGS